MSSPTDAVYASGFPLQMAIEHILRESPEHAWRVIGSEVQWNRPNAEKALYADLVLSRAPGLKHVAVLECKRWDSEFVFLVPPQSDKPTEEAHLCWYGSHRVHRTVEGGWSRLRAYPASDEAGFCVLTKRSGGHEARLLEGAAAELVAATEALVAIEAGRKELKRSGEPVLGTPILVTTAQLFVCVLDPAKVDLDSGDPVEGSLDLRSVDVVRFRKSLGSTPRPSLGLDDNYEASQRTVLVVRPTGLVALLKSWKIGTFQSLAPWHGLQG